MEGVYSKKKKSVTTSFEVNLPARFLLQKLMVPVVLKMWLADSVRESRMVSKGIFYKVQTEMV